MRMTTNNFQNNFFQELLGLTYWTIFQISFSCGGFSENEVPSTLQLQEIDSACLHERLESSCGQIKRYINTKH